MAQFNPKELSIDKSVPWQKSSSANPVEISQEIKGRFPNGVDAIVVAVSMNPGWREIRQSNGIIAILIGLLVPQVHEVKQQFAKRMQLETALKMGGHFGVSFSNVDQLGNALPTIGWVRKFG